MRRIILTVASLAAICGPLATAQAGAKHRHNCGRVTLKGPIAFRVHMQTQYMTCAAAKRIVTRTLFGQGAPPPDGFFCSDYTSSTEGKCRKGPKVVVYAQSLDNLPHLDY